MKPFDLEKALAGEPVVNGRGDVVQQLFYFVHASQEDFKLQAVINGRLSGYTIYGGFNLAGNDKERDLFMAPVKKEGWVNVTDVYSTREEAEKGLAPAFRMLTPKAIKIEWEE